MAHGTVSRKIDSVDDFLYVDDGDDSDSDESNNEGHEPSQAYPVLMSFSLTQLSVLHQDKGGMSLTEKWEDLMSTLDRCVCWNNSAGNSVDEDLIGLAFIPHNY